MAAVEQRGHVPLPHLRAWRTHRVLTREKLAAKAGLTESALAKLELGKTQGARFSTVDKLAKALGVKTDQLIHEAPPDDAPATNTPAHSTRKTTAKTAAAS